MSIYKIIYDEIFNLFIELQKSDDKLKIYDKMLNAINKNFNALNIKKIDEEIKNYRFIETVDEDGDYGTISFADILTCLSNIYLEAQNIKLLGSGYCMYDTTNNINELYAVISFLREKLLMGYEDTKSLML